MTAERSGYLAVGRFWGALKVLRDQWLVAAFAATSLIWAHDMVLEYVDLPARVTAQEHRVDDLGVTVGALGGPGARTGRRPMLAFPGTAHRVGDGNPGAPVLVVLTPVMRLREDCDGIGLSAFVIDGDGRWHVARTSIGHLPRLAVVDTVRFTLTVPAQAAPGPAALVLQLTQICGARQQVEQLERIPFRILSDMPNMP